MASSISSNCSFSSNISTYSSFIELLRSRNSSSTKLVNGKSKFSIPIKCKNECPKNSCCIRIINLSRRVSADNLLEIFSEFGEIKKIDIHFNRYDRISKGVSYIMFSTPEESKNAVQSMNRCEIDEDEIICELWFLPYVEYHVSSILRSACSGVGYRSLSRRLPPTHITHYSSQLDRLRYYSKFPLTSPKCYYMTTNESCPESSKKSYPRSPRQSRLRSHSNSQNREDSICSKSSRYKSSKKFCSKYSRKPY
ncbi:uncharacterized protein LOC112591581 [Melanaphis sacchari]|uniref:uncharacterized protein LOC112591581 n=1 Tax=Melanaphis sacchari TaxID=742174 RepID=UPI000DC13C44|nr:uncharacterized protein LOC112591581 [Melanaphis sacchari]